MSVNGGAIGYYHVNADWGDPLYASLYGTGATAFGGEYASGVLATMYEEPESLYLRYLSEAKGGPLETTPAQADKEACLAKCKGLPTLSYYACVTKCGLSVQDVTRSWGDLRDFIGKNIPLALLGVLLIAIGAYSVTTR